MPILFVAFSKTQQDWAADVGLGKNLYKVGLTQEEQSPEDHLDGHAGQTDWKVVKAVAAPELTEQALLDKLARKEKLVDPAYYPKLRGANGLVKVNLAAIENANLVAHALEGREAPKGKKLKPMDVADYLIRNIL